jgi:hypothetical protein
MLAGGTVCTKRNANSVTFIRAIVAVGCGLSGLGALICAITGTYHMIQAARSRRPDAPYRQIVQLWPLNAVLFADQLDENGLRHRTQAFRSQIKIAWLMGAMIATALLLALTR